MSTRLPKGRNISKHGEGSPPVEKSLSSSLDLQLNQAGKEIIHHHSSVLREIVTLLAELTVQDLAEHSEVDTK